MSIKKLKIVLLAGLLALSLGLAACGDSNSDSGETSKAESSGTPNLIESNADNGKTTLTIGSKNFTEQIVLGQIYAQALQAAGYQVKTDLNLGSETVALKALEQGEISGYPEYVSTALTSFFNTPAEDVPSDSEQAYQRAKEDLAKDGIEALPPTPFQSANAVGMLASEAEKLGVKTISDLKGKSQDLTLYGSPECRQRIDCLLGLQQNYGLKFKSFTPVDIGLRYQVLDKGQADLSILFTTDAELGASDKYTTLEDDKGVLPAGNVIFLTKPATIEQAGPDYAATIEKVQEGLTEKVMQELDARVDIDKQKPEDVAAEYLKSAGYIE